MRRTDEEFKAEVFRRKTAYCKKRRKQIAAVSAGVLPIIAAAIVIFQPHMKSAPEANGTVSNYALEVSVSQSYGSADPESAFEAPMEMLVMDDAAYLTVDSGLGESEFATWDAAVVEKIQKLIDSFSQQVTENTKRTDETEEEYRIRLTDHNETTVYLLKGGSLYDEDGKLIGSNPDAAEELIALIEELI